MAYPLITNVTNVRIPRIPTPFASTATSGYNACLLQPIATTTNRNTRGLNHSAVFATSDLANTLYGALLTVMSPTTVGWIAAGLMILPGIAWLAALAAGRLPDAQPVPGAATGAIRVAESQEQVSEGQRPFVSHPAHA